MSAPVCPRLFVHVHFFIHSWTRDRGTEKERESATRSVELVCVRREIEEVHMEREEGIRCPITDNGLVLFGEHGAGSLTTNPCGFQQHGYAQEHTGSR